MTEGENKGTSVDAELQALKLQQRGETIRTGLRCFFGAVCAVVVYLCIDALSGEKTDANIALKVVASTPTKLVVFVAFSIALGLWVIGARNLHRKKTEYMTNRISELETGIDPSRTSSGLDPSGATNPQDK